MFTWRFLGNQMGEFRMWWPSIKHFVTARLHEMCRKLE